MKMISLLSIAAFLISTGANARADSPSPQCERKAVQVVRALRVTDVLRGNFKKVQMTEVKETLPDGEFEMQERYEFNHPEGYDTVEVLLSRDICELRQIIHQVPL